VSDKQSTLLLFEPINSTIYQRQTILTLKGGVAMYGQLGTLEDLEKTLKHLDMLRINIMKAINNVKFGLNKNLYHGIKPEYAHPLSKVTYEKVDDIPYFQFSYDGMLPHFRENDNEYLSMTRNYYLKATLDSYDYNKIDYKFHDAVIIYVQYFKNDIIRDLENRNKKYIQDAIKVTGLIADDHWSNVWNADLGFKDTRGNHVQVYLVSQSDFGKFYSILIERHHEMKRIDFLDDKKLEIMTQIKGEKQDKNTEKNNLSETSKLSDLF